MNLCLPRTFFFNCNLYFPPYKYILINVLYLYLSFLYSRWLYLEPILSNDDGELGVKFRKVDLGFRQVTRILESDPRLSALLQSSRLQPMLDSISEQLLTCQSALNLYIDVSCIHITIYRNKVIYYHNNKLLPVYVHNHLNTENCYEIIITR